MRHKAFLGLVVGLYSLAATARGAGIWTGTSGDFTVEWKTTDITAARRDRPGEPVLSLRKEAARLWAETTKDAAGRRLESSLNIRIRSLVGPVLSVEEESYCDCGGAHPSATTRFRAIDLTRSRPGQTAPFLLTDTVAARDVLAALSADDLVKHALAGSGARPPASLPDLLKGILFQPVEAGSGDCTYAFGPDAMSSFAFYDAGPKDAAVRLSLSHAVEVCRGQMVQVGIRVAVLDRLRTALDQAKERKEGFLMIDAGKVAARGASTKFEFKK